MRRPWPPQRSVISVLLDDRFLAEDHLPDGGFDVGQPVAEGIDPSEDFAVVVYRSGVAHEAPISSFWHARAVSGRHVCATTPMA